MTRKEAIEYWELFNSEIDDLLLLYRSNVAYTEVLEEQREAAEFTIAALRKIDALALDGKHNEGCAWCKAEYTIIDDEFAQPISQKMIKFCWHCGRKLEGNNGQKR